MEMNKIVKYIIFSIGVMIMALNIAACTGAGETPGDTTVAKSNSGSEEIVKALSTIKVMSLNVYGTDAPNQPVLNSDTIKADSRVLVRGPKFLALLEGEGIDIAGCQEVSSGWRSFIKDKLGDKYAYTGGIMRDTNGGNWILYRLDKFDLADSGVFWLAPDAPRTYTKAWNTCYDRICSWALFKVRETGDYFFFFDTHLDIQNGTWAATESAKLITEQIEQLCTQAVSLLNIKSCPAIVVGDMNSTPNSEAYNAFNTSLRDALVYSKGTKVLSSYSSSPGYNYITDGMDYIKNGHRIDYIFVTSDITVNNYKMIHTSTNCCEYGEFISDHNAIIADITFGN